MTIRPDRGKWAYAVIGMMALAFHTTMQLTDGVFHPLVFVSAVAFDASLVLVGLTLWGVLRQAIRAIRRRGADPRA